MVIHKLEDKVQTMLEIKQTIFNPIKVDVTV